MTATRALRSDPLAGVAAVPPPEPTLADTRARPCQGFPDTRVILAIRSGRASIPWR